MWVLKTPLESPITNYFLEIAAMPTLNINTKIREYCEILFVKK
jgi:hypothetical protein